MLNNGGQSGLPNQFFKFYNFFILTLSKSLPQLKYILSKITDKELFNVLIYTKINNLELTLCKINIIKELSDNQKDIIMNPDFSKTYGYDDNNDLGINNLEINALRFLIERVSGIKYCITY